MIEWSSAALEQLEEHCEFIDNHVEGIASEDVVVEIVDTIASLERFPKMGRRIKNNIYKLTAVSSRYIIHYTIGNTVRIEGIYHYRQNRDRP